MSPSPVLLILMLNDFFSHSHDCVFLSISLSSSVSSFSWKRKDDTQRIWHKTDCSEFIVSCLYSSIFNSVSNLFIFFFSIPFYLFSILLPSHIFPPLLTPFFHCSPFLHCLLPLPAFFLPPSFFFFFFFLTVSSPRSSCIAEDGLELTIF